MNIEEMTVAEIAKYLENRCESYIFTYEMPEAADEDVIMSCIHFGTVKSKFALASYTRVSMNNYMKDQLDEINEI